MGYVLCCTITRYAIYSEKSFYCIQVVRVMDGIVIYSVKLLGVSKSLFKYFITFKHFVMTTCWLTYLNFLHKITCIHWHQKCCYGKKIKNKIKVVFVELCSLVIAYNIPTWEVYFPLNAHISIQTSKHEGQTETILLFKLCKKVR